MKKFKFYIITLTIVMSNYIVFVDAAIPPAKKFYPINKIDEIIKKARGYKEKRYQWGGNGDGDHGIDCSGLTHVCFLSEGIDIPRNSRAQANYDKIGGDVEKKSDLQKGDLIFFETTKWYIGHVGLVVSTKNNKVRFIHSSSEKDCREKFSHCLESVGNTGHKEGVRESYLVGKWKNRFVKGKRIFRTIKFTPYKKNIVVKTQKQFTGKYPKASQEKLTIDELKEFNEWQLRIMLNEIFARHGYQFNKNPRVQNYFNRQDWYHNIPKTSKNGGMIYNNYLSDIEKYNINVIKKYRKTLLSATPNKVSVIKNNLYDDISEEEYLPGKYPQASLRKLADDDLKNLTGLDKLELKIMRNEIFARHGYIFTTDDMKVHFEGQSWYVKIIDGSEGFVSEYYLSDIEEANIKLIKKCEKASKKYHSNIPGEFPQASQRQLTKADLEGLSKWELKIMRNEIFARHGYIFTTKSMVRYFVKQKWYTTIPNKKENVYHKLSHIEKHNIKYIQAQE